MATQIYDYQQLKHQVRYAKTPDNPLLIKKFLDTHPWPCDTKRSLRRLCRRQFNLLLDAVVDECLPAHWRSQCLDHVYIPLQRLAEMVDSEQSTQEMQLLNEELRVCSHYFQICYSSSLHYQQELQSYEPIAI